MRTSVFNAPRWIEQYEFPFTNYETIPTHLFQEVNQKLIKKCQSAAPLVSVVIAAWNEEANLLKTIASLSDMDTQIPFEIIVVNNNSTDRTQDVLDRLALKSLFQPIQGCGAARQMGLEAAAGEYILLADADCIYPNNWLSEMVGLLKQPGVVCVYGRYSFIPEKSYPRWQLFLFEKLKDSIANLRHYKHPYLNTLGMSMGFIKSYALQVGFVLRNIRGEDGRMCFDLMKFGKVKQLKRNSTRVWTKPRTLQKDGTLLNAFGLRVRKEFKRFTSLFKEPRLHDTKTSEND